MKFGHFSALCLKKEIGILNKIGSFLKSNAFAFKFTTSQKVAKTILKNSKNLLNSAIYAGNSDCNKVAFIVRKKLGNAPARNKIKRKLREILAKIEPNQPISMLIIAKPEAFLYPFDRLENEIRFMLAKIQKNLDLEKNDQNHG